MTALPADRTSFLGRENEVAEAGKLLGRTRLLTLTGPGGVGKSRLAHRVAEALRVAEHVEVAHVDLDAVDTPERLPPFLAGAVRPGLHPEDLPVVLAGRRVLLVVDTCEHLVGACRPLFEELLDKLPGLRILATSRHVLHIAGEQVYQVQPLPVAGTAVRLLRERAAAANPDLVFDEDTLHTLQCICSRLDGFPLALELAAGWLRALSPAELLAHVDGALALPDGGGRAAPGRHHDLDANAEWSYRLCTPEERLLWARLSTVDSLFGLTGAGACPPGDAAQAEETLRLMAGLVDKSLVVRHTVDGVSHYRIPSPLRRFGMRMLADLRPRPATGRRVPSATGLSERELEVARLVAEGLTNGQIAHRLTVAKRTAETHVYHILSKLGFRSRTQIAAWVINARFRSAA
ncbi:putative ATPase [Crossiella equi]|uniref:ATPase n=1 Tax=Crossiella equi TaxID=130796 RepID=A0ABS5AQT5_9PSEU|nr:LuxR C-terminal-related transcriptional regulator [Crossiella equi]MBP2478933.1 putative ATPase [Crossiella equi]